MAVQEKHPILVVDDEPEILFSLRGLLRRDFEVHTAESGAQALEILKQQPVHVIMTDQRMPEMTGAELLHRSRTEHPEAIRIVFTGYADIKAVVDAVNQGGIYRYLTKPWDPDELIEVLHGAAAQYERYVAQQRLLDDLQSYLPQATAVLKGLLEQQYGTLNDAGRTEVETLAKSSNILLEQLSQILKKLTANC
jgi:DNA-binding NtrC family response regulator